jgi:pSer/pThr/pTyr-binding forkhead associated (FHA) protein
MKLIFPNGEHEQVSLTDGVTRIGSSSDCQIVLVAPGVAMDHCEIELRKDQAVVRVRDTSVATVLNGRQITGETALKSGDLLLFGRIGCRVSVSEQRAAASVTTAAPVAEPVEEEGRTRIRMAMPKYVLRGVSGVTFGKTFALTGTMTIGRQSSCEIPVPAEEISRHHARLQVTAAGVMVEDLGSANGTWINDKRVHSGVLNPGDELRLDTIRFQLLTPAAYPPAGSRPDEVGGPPYSSEKKSGSKLGMIIGAGLVAAAAAVIGVLFALGKL